MCAHTEVRNFKTKFSLTGSGGAGTATGALWTHARLGVEHKTAVAECFIVGILQSKMAIS